MTDTSPTIPMSDLALDPLGEGLLGPVPGASASLFGERRSEPSVLSGRLGGTAPRIPTRALDPGRDRFAIGPSVEPLGRESADAPINYGTLERLPDDELGVGPLDGLTLDQAIERLLRANLELRARFLELPQAEADILTASLRTNPVLFSDVQMVPYGGYSDARPGGPTQYDINVTWPLDLSHKRQRRINVAVETRAIRGQQYRDAARVQIGNLGTVFINALAAQESERLLEAGLRGLDRAQEVARSLYEAGTLTDVDVGRLEVRQQTAALALADARLSRDRAVRELAALLDLEPEQVGTDGVRGQLERLDMVPPPVETLVNRALAERPDLAAVRRGVALSLAGVDLARAEAFEDVFLLVQPYTFQDLSPFEVRSAHSWGVGVTVPLPIFDRNQGNIQRAELNVARARTLVQSLERRVVTDVRNAAEDEERARLAALSIRDQLIPIAERIRNGAARLLDAGEVDALAYLTALGDYNEAVRQYLDVLVRHRRSQLEINTAVGARVLP